VGISRSGGKLTRDMLDSKRASIESGARTEDMSKSAPYNMENKNKGNIRVTDWSQQEQVTSIYAPAFCPSRPQFLLQPRLSHRPRRYLVAS
jgi:hypothetical protein